MSRVENSASIILFGFFRILRALTGVWACAIAVNVFAGCAATLNEGAGEKGAAFLIVQSILFTVAALTFAGSKLVINAIHRKIHGVAHPKLVKVFSL